MSRQLPPSFALTLTAPALCGQAAKGQVLPIPHSPKINKYSVNKFGIKNVTTSITPDKLSTVELKPNYNIPLVLIIAAIPSLAVNVWVGGVIAILGLFLMLQAGIIRLQFTATDLEVYRGEKIIRSFPYQEWQNWRIFWNRVPILFYFKEVKSIHFLPIIFDANTLKACLEQRCPRI